MSSLKKFSLKFSSYLLIISFLTLMNHADASYSSSIKIKTITSISHLTKIIPANSEALICVNLDEVLMEPQQYLGSHSWFCSQRFMLEKNTKNRLPLLDLVTSYNAVNLLCHKQLIENESIETFSELFSQTDAKFLGISYKDVTLAELTLDELLENNFNFSAHCFHDSEIAFEKGNEPLDISKTMIFKEGCLFLATNCVYEGLQVLFQKTEFLPRKLFYISSSLEEIKAVGQTFQGFGVDVIGIFYERSDFLYKVENNKKLKAANICLSEFQSILPDDTILAILNF